ncbi:MAG: hypothetical protein P8163_12590 [Candidatus Thiodiazotropha sp.]
MGGHISDNPSQLVEYDQIFGASGHRTKMAYYVKMNSTPGVADGTLKQWVNDELILSNKNTPWTGPEPWVTEAGSSMPEWDVVGFWGNSFFPPTEVDADTPYALTDQHFYPDPICITIHISQYPTSSWVFTITNLQKIT